MSILKSINNPEALRGLTQKELRVLCEEIRQFLIYGISETGGHLASNLGVVELTVALHCVFDTHSDRLVFDVGHQSYVHKILTGRREKFNTLRQFGGISGFPKPSESVHDAFVAGHASTSVSVALGMARARSLTKEKYHVLAVIGDGALTGGLSYEALNDAGQSGEPLIVVLNDNGMSIAGNVGGIARHLSHLRLKSGYYTLKKRYRKFVSAVPGGRHLYRFTHWVKTAIKNAVFHCSMFEDMGFHYLGPVDGHDPEKLISVLNWAKTLKEPVLVHVSTIKGKGYSFAEESPNAYHGVGKFCPETGVTGQGKDSFSHCFGRTMLELAAKDSRVCAITAAMQEGTGLGQFSSVYPERFFDVGIAEEHAVAMAAGMAKQGLIPVFSVYSSFLQRSYDMLIHDVSLLDLHVVFAVDRAGLVGEDGETHHGVFDVGFLSQIPNMTVLCPASFSELEAMMEHAVFHITGPVAVRYPRGGEGVYTDLAGVDASKILRAGKDLTVVSYGTMIGCGEKLCALLFENGISPELIKLNAVNPIDYKTVLASLEKTRRLVVMEDCAEKGSVGQRILARLALEDFCLKSVVIRNLGDGIISHGLVDQLLLQKGLTPEQLFEDVLAGIRAEKP